MQETPYTDTYGGNKIVTTTELLDIAKQQGLDVFDVITQIGVGTGTTAPTISDTALETELDKFPLNITAVKDNGNGTYTFQCRIPITEQNGVSFAETGLFDVSNVMYGRELFDSTFTKTDSQELVFDLVVTIVATNIQKKWQKEMH